MPNPFMLYQVLEKEYEELHGPLPADYPQAYLPASHQPTGHQPEQSLSDEHLTAIFNLIHERARGGRRRTALCFSGGGIRSATFGLGVLQGLAQRGLLTEFDYLSTVSGGGYLGGWFSAWLKHERDKICAGRAATPADSEAAVRKVQAELKTAPLAKLQPEPEPVRHLRSYSNYMSPRLGLLSADTWTLAAIYFRNLFLNQLVLVPLILGVLALPRLSLAVTRWQSPGPVGGGWLGLVFWGAVACGIVAISYIIANRPSIADAVLPGGRSVSRVPKEYRKEWRFLLCCMLCLLALAFLIATYWAWLRVPSDGLEFTPLGYELPHNVFAFALFGVLLYGGAYVLTQVLLVRKLLLADPLVAVATGAIGGLLTYLMAAKVFDNPFGNPGTAEGVLSAALYVCFGAPVFLLLFLAAATVFVGLASFYTTDADREWLARAGAWVLIAAAVWMALSLVVIFGPVALFYFGAKLVAGIGSAAGAVTLAGGASGKTKANDKEEAKEGSSAWTPLLKRVALALAAPIFAVFLLIVLSLVTSYLYLAIYNALAEAGGWADGLRALLAVGGPLAPAALPHLPYDQHGLLNILYHLPGRFVLALTLVVVAVGVVMGFFVNINKFSLHGAYRDRLIRAYLGASRRKTERKPNPFTGFDVEDNMAMSELGSRPLHVVNMTLNLVSLSGEQLAWQDRKAESFTASRLFSGSFCITDGGYRPSADYARGKSVTRGISLGTAVAISGAAASPNMGYYSSKFVTFLLSLFNVRLGWWLGNPGRAGARTYGKPGPSFGPRALVAETLGWTDDRHPYVYLSDGGHFENLGLYEMVLRRCHFIVVCDGSADPSLTFNDLGNAVGKIRDDLGIPIVFDDIPITPRERDKLTYTQGAAKDEKYCAVGRICYSRKDTNGVDGVLIYLKPNVYGGEPADVFNYARSNRAFPHESTGDQMYSESQFESYRALGYHIVQTICKGGQVSDLGTLEQQVCAYLGSPGAAVSIPSG
jgi:Patatin-like phospholipase